MESPSDLVTIFRSLDPSAEEDAAQVCDTLTRAGLQPTLLTDEAPGVPSGTVVVKVPASQEKAAEAALAAPPEPGDTSEALDLVDVFEGVGTTAELDAIGIRAVLDASNIPSVIVGASQYPNLPFLVKVPQKFLGQAQTVLAEAAKGGPAAAEEAEKATEL